MDKCFALVGVPTDKRREGQGKDMVGTHQEWEVV